MMLTKIVDGRDVPVCTDMPINPDHYFFKRKYVATIKGERVEFKSYMRLGTYDLWSEAIRVCEKKIPWFKRTKHQDEVLINGYAMPW